MYQIDEVFDTNDVDPVVTGKSRFFFDELENQLTTAKSEVAMVTRGSSQTLYDHSSAFLYGVLLPLLLVLQ